MGALSGVGGQSLQSLISVGVHVGLTGDLGNQPAILGNDECRPFRGQWSRPAHAELSGNLSLRVREQGKSQIVGGVELFLSIRPINADSHDLRTELCELRRQVTEVTALLRSARRHGLYVEVQDQRTVGKKIGEVHESAVLIDRFEILDNFTRTHRDLTSRSDRRRRGPQKVPVTSAKTWGA
jgi:hypothetical protein